MRQDQAPENPKKKAGSQKAGVQEVLNEFQRKKGELEVQTGSEQVAVGKLAAKAQSILAAAGKERKQHVRALLSDSSAWLEGLHEEHSSNLGGLAAEGRTAAKRLKTGGTLEELAASKQRIAEALRQLQAKCIQPEKGGGGARRAKSVSFRT